MKTLKPRYDYLLLFYLPIVVAGFVLAFFFPHSLVIIFALISLVFLIAALIVAVSPLGRQQMVKTRPVAKHWWLLLFALQLGSGLIYWLWQPAMPSGTLVPLMFSSGLYPWPCYLLFALALAHFGLPLKSNLQPVLGKASERILGTGADLFMKQSLFFIAAFTIAIFILQISAAPVGLNFSILLLSTLLFMLIASPAWRRYSYYLWQERYPVKFFLLTTALLLLFVILIFNGLAYFIGPYLPHLSPFSWHLAPRLADGQLISFVWWLAWAPLIAQQLQPIIQGQKIWKIIIVGSILPSIFSLLHWLPVNFYPASMPFMYLPLLILSLGLVIFCFNDKMIAGLLSSASSGQRHKRLSLAAIRSLLFLIPVTLAAYALTGLSFIPALAFSFAAPCFLVICAASSGYMLYARKEVDYGR